MAPTEAAHALADAVREAADVALALFRAGCRNWTKDRDSPVTEADVAADELLRTHLRALAPDYGWQSEESEPVAARGSPRTWIVDPIDGTRAFIRGLPDWVVAAALVEDGRSLAAAVASPVTEELFVAARGGGATRNGAPMAASRGRALAGARIAGPRALLERLAQRHAIVPVPRVHSLALRFVRVATGEIDAALASGKSRDWDLAAADLLVHEAGASLTTSAGEGLRYERADAEHPPLAAAGRSLHATLLAALADLSQHAPHIRTATTRIAEP